MFASQRKPAAPAATELPDFAADWCLFLDVDGTLLELAAKPDAVRVDDRLRDILRTLRAALGGALALITGRSVSDIDALFAPDILPVGGQHGAERRDADGVLHAPAGGRDGLRSTAARLRRLLARDPGLLVEEKGMSVAVHFRQAPELAGAAYNAVMTVLRSLGSGYELQTGKMVFEIKPGGHDKGTAIAAFLREAPFRGRTPVFIGDDLTDEYGFERVNRIGGHSIKVGSGDSAARWRVADASAVLDWLEAYAAFLPRA